MNEIFSFSNVINSCVFAVVTACLYLACSKKMVGALQQCGYDNKKFRAWYKRKDNLLKHRYILTALLIFFSSACLSVCFLFLGKDVSAVLSVCSFILFTVLFVVADFKYALKVPVKITARYKRLCVVYVLFLAIFNYIGVTLLNIAAYYINEELAYALKFVPMAVYVVLLPYILTFTNDVCGIYEKSHSKKFVLQAEKTLRASSAVKIGITGSYGKTSVKNILNTILSEKYNVLATPYSYNTPLGVAKCVNSADMSNVEVFICEMGARHVGDIDELCDTVSLDYGILTGICPQHLESFKNVENIILEKSKIIKRAKKGFVSVNTEGIESIGDKHSLILGKDIIISELVANKDGTSFALECNGRKLDLSTKLLTAHSAENIALAVGIAMMLSLTDEEIERGVSKIEYSEHRLQVIKSGGVTVIDDSYNSNIVGAKDSIEALKMFDGEKYVLTPGLVELGILEVKENEKFGAELVGIDNVILIGETLVGAVQRGYLNAGGDEKKLTVVPTLLAATDILKEKLRDGDCVLFLNDLPDVY